MEKNDFNEGLLGFLDASPTPFHATKNISLMLENAGFSNITVTPSLGKPEQAIIITGEKP